MRAATMPKLNARMLVWLVGAGVCTAYYWLRTQPFPRRTAVGIEHRLFGLGVHVPPPLQERPGGGPVLMTMAWDDPPPSATPPPKPEEWPLWLYEHARLRLGTGPRGARPALTPFPPQVTWRVEGDRLRYGWRLAGRWRGDRYLEAENFDGRLGPQGTWLLELATGRTYRGPAADARRAGFEAQDAEEEFISYGAGVGPNPVSPALDDFDPNADRAEVSHLLERREVVLRWAGDGSYAADLTASTTTEPHQSRVLSPRSALLAATRDGRRLYLLKEDGMWRLDLRKPVLELLREVTVPELPLESIGRETR